jgi:CRP/FNR family transcriptional regulator/CRP/FNR family cyclic AMP-dependent transcriptional regulator
LSRRLRVADEKIGSLALLDVYGRIAGALLQIARTEGKVVGDRIIIDERPTQQDIASMAGASRETVSRVLNDLVKSGLISMEGKKVIINRDLHHVREVNS